MNELLSICIPTYNRANILNDCLKNLFPLAQKYEIPIYVSDNASTDHTEEVVNNLKKSYSHIYYFRNKENLKDLNYGLVLKMAKSKYAWLFNDKSRLKPESLEIILEELKKGPSLLILNASDLDGSNIRVTDLSAAKTYTDRNELLSDLGWHMTMVSTTIWSKDMIEKGDFKKYLGSPFLQLQTLLEYLANKEFSAYWEPKPLFANLLVLSGWAKGKDSKIFDFFWCVLEKPDNTITKFTNNTKIIGL